MHHSTENLLKVNKNLIDKSFVILKGEWDEEGRSKLRIEVSVQRLKTRLVSEAIKYELDNYFVKVKPHNFFDNIFLRPITIFFMKKRLENKYYKLLNQYIKLNGIDHIISNRMKFNRDIFQNPFLAIGR